MAKKGEKTLTRKRVEKLGFDEASVITADMLEGYTNIGDGAFHGCRGLTSIEIPDSITSIGEWAFYGCRSLTSVIIPNSVISIESYAFSDCISLISVTIPNNVTSIESYVFSDCISLVSVTIPNTVANIGDGAFRGCRGLTSVTIPNSVTRIGHGAFYECSGLTSVTIPDSIKDIGNDAFERCNFEYKEEPDVRGRVIAYKGFNVDMTCRDFQYKEGETYEIEGEPILCERGFHACLNPMDCFGYYCGQIGKDIVFHEVYLEGVSDEKSYGSKVVARKITIGREISLSEMADIANGRK